MLMTIFFPWKTEKKETLRMNELYREKECESRRVGMKNASISKNEIYIADKKNHPKEILKNQPGNFHFR